MNRKTLFRLSSMFLDYPDEERIEYLGRLLKELREKGQTDGTLSELERIYREFREKDIMDLQKDYVELFDMNRDVSLYLTAWEYGDNRERGRELLRLKEMLDEAHYIQPKGELPDHVPTLLMFLSGLDGDKRPPDLEQRLALFFQHAQKKIQSGRYADLFRLLHGAIPIKIEAKMANYVEPDSEEYMPYPISYEGDGDD